MVAIDATIEQSCPKEMRNILPKSSGPIHKDKACGKATTLSNGISLDFLKANAFHCKGHYFLCKHKIYQAKDDIGEKDDNPM